MSDRACYKISHTSQGSAYEGEVKKFSELDYPITVLIGPAHCGKTHLLKWLSELRGIPILAVKEYLRTPRSKRASFSKLILDGLDECRKGKLTEGIETLVDALKENPPDKLYIACRQNFWSAEHDLKELKKINSNLSPQIYGLLYLNREEAMNILQQKKYNKSFISRFFQEICKRNYQPIFFGSPPLLLELAEFYKKEEYLPVDSQEVMNWAFEQQLTERNTKHSSAQSSVECFSLEERKELMGKLCVSLDLTGRRSLTTQVKAKSLSSVFSDGEAGEHPIAIQEIGKYEEELVEKILGAGFFEPTTNDGAFVLQDSVMTSYITGWFLAQKNTDLGCFLPPERILSWLSYKPGRGYYHRVRREFEDTITWYLMCLKPADLRRLPLQEYPDALLALGAKEPLTSDDQKHLSADFFRRLCQGGRMLDFFIPLYSFENIEAMFNALLSRQDLSKESSNHFIHECLYLIMRQKPTQQYARIFTKIIKGPEWPFRLKRLAIRAHQVHCSRREEATGFFDHPFARIALDIIEGHIVDADYEVLGLILSELYTGPEVLGDICTLLQPSPRPFCRYGEYHDFWHKTLPQKLAQESPKLLEEVMDEFCWKVREESTDKNQGICTRLTSKVYAESLLLSWMEAYFKISQDEKTPPSFFPWLTAILRSSDLSRKGRYYPSLHEWFISHPETLKEFTTYLAKQPIDGRYSPMIHAAIWIHNFGWPEGYGEWCWEEVRRILAAKKNAQSPKDYPYWLVAMLARFVCQRKPDMEKEIRFYLREHPSLVDYLNQGINNQKRAFSTHNNESLIEEASDQKRIEAEMEAERTSLTCKNKKKLPGSKNSDDAGAALSELRSLLQQGNLTVVEQLTQAKEQRKKVLNSFDAVYTIHKNKGSSNPLADIGLKDNEIKIILQYLFTTPIFVLSERETKRWEPEWELAFAQHAPDLYSEILIRLFIVHAKQNLPYQDYLHNIIFHKEYRYILQKIWKILLKEFPLRCPNDQLPILGEIIILVLRKIRTSEPHAETNKEIEILLEEKIGSPTIGATQKVYWHFMAFMLEPEKHTQSFDVFLREGRKRKHHWVSMLLHLRRNERIYSQEKNSPDPLEEVLDTMSPEAISWMIEKVGPDYKPYQWDTESGLVEMTESIRGAEWTRYLIHRLARSKQKHDLLPALQKCEALSAWKGLLGEAISFRESQEWQRSCQESAASKTQSPYMSLEDVKGNVIDRRRLAKDPKDLSLCVQEAFRDMQREINGSDIDLRGPFWDGRDKSGSRPPKLEVQCRDHVIQCLRVRLKDHGVNFRPEAQSTGESRMDIRAECLDFSIPIEIKKSNQEGRKIAAGLSEQLIGKYTKEQECDGYGILLVLWFGASHCKRIKPEAEVPRSPQELQEQLRGGLSDEDKARISIIVLDVSYH